MKNPHATLRLLTILILAGLTQAVFADHYSSTANHLAEQFLQQKDHSDEALTPFLEKQGIGEGDIKKACQQAVQRALKLVKAGAIPGKPAFGLLLAEATGERSTGGTRPVATEGAEPADTGEAPPAAGPRTTNQSAWLKGSTGGNAIFFHTGVRVLTPYKIDYATRKISSDGTETGGFMEVVASNIWSWQPDFMAQSRAAEESKRLETGRRKNEKLGTRKTEEELLAAAKLKDYDWQSLRTMHWDEGWDYQGRLSFEFGADKEASAATITGSGDIGAEVAFAKHVARGWTPGGAWSVGLGGALNAITDRRARKVHHTLFAGVTSATSFVVKDGDEKRLALLRIGFGYANVEGIVYDDPTLDTIKFDGAVPHFESRWRPAAGAELWWPMGKAGYLTAGARIYSRSKPDQWTLYLGATLDIPKAISSLNPNNATEKTK